MISSLRGIARKGEHPVVTLEVQGVGYEVQCVAPLWERLREGEDAQIFVHTFVREDRLELFGFGSVLEKKLFHHFLCIPGVGPRIALQLCGVSKGMLQRAVETQDARSLSSLKGIGKKMAEKLLVELQALVEKGVLVSSPGEGGEGSGILDEDALEALTNLGYDRRSMLARLREIADAKTTEERVKRVLQTL